MGSNQAVAATDDGNSDKADVDCFEKDTPIAEVDEFLKKYEMFDPSMPAGLRKKRYSRFCTTTFDLLPPERWAACFKDLLQFEEMCAGS